MLELQFPRDDGNFQYGLPYNPYIDGDLLIAVNKVLNNDFCHMPQFNDEKAKITTKRLDMKLFPDNYDGELVTSKDENSIVCQAAT